MLRRRHVISACKAAPVLSGRIHGIPSSLDREDLFPPRVIRRKRCSGCVTSAANLPTWKTPMVSSRVTSAGKRQTTQGRVGRMDGAVPEAPTHGVGACRRGSAQGAATRYRTVVALARSISPAPARGGWESAAQYLGK